MCSSLDLVPWLANRVTSTSHYLPCVRALPNTSYRGERHGVGKGGDRGRERIQERLGKAGGGGMGTGTAKGEAGANGEGSGGRIRKGVRW